MSTDIWRWSQAYLKSIFCRLHLSYVAPPPPAYGHILFQKLSKQRDYETMYVRPFLEEDRQIQAK